MDKKKKIILISVVIIIVIFAIAAIAWTSISNNNEVSEGEVGNSKINDLYTDLISRDYFSFEVILDDDNSRYYAKLNDAAYTDTIYNGTESIYLIKDGNSYLLVDRSKTYYTYSNNSINLNMITEQLEDLKDAEYQEGKENIDGKNYNYEEYSGVTNFALGDFTNDTAEVKTKFYFDGDELVYIKTIEGEQEELLKVTISYDVDESLFQIPSDYSEA